MSPLEFREGRKSLGLRQSDLAEILAYSGQVHISRIENGDSVPPCAALAMRAMLAFGPPDHWPQRMDANDPLIACRALEARYLAANGLSEIEDLVEVLTALLDFAERHSHRWYGENGSHPQTIVERGTRALAQTKRKFGLK
jgi:transcriptional regulator with XRE-family HTH domain